MYRKILLYLEKDSNPEKFKKFTALAATSALLEGRVFLRETLMETIRPNLFIIFIAPPGTGKSVAAEISYKVATHYNKKFVEGDPDMSQETVKLVPSANITSAGMLDWMKRFAIKQVNLASGPFDSTPSFIMASELSVLVGNASHGNILSDLLEMYDGREWFSKYLKGDKYSKIPTPVPTLLACCTPSYWFEDIPTGIVRDGFTSRSLLLYSEDFVERAPEREFGNPQLWENVLADARRLMSLKGEFEIDNDASYWFIHSFHKETEEMRYRYRKVEGLWSSYANRRNLQLKKIAMCLAASDSSDLVIRKAHFEEARELLLVVESTLSALVMRKDIKFNDKLSSLICKVVTQEPIELGAIQEALGQMGYIVLPADLQLSLSALVDQSVLTRQGEKYRRKL